MFAGYGRVIEGRRAVALAHHVREAEGLSIAEIAERLGRSPTTIKACFYDPTGEEARAVKARYVGRCCGCDAYTQPRNGKGDAYAYATAATRALSAASGRPSVLAAMRDWGDRYGSLPTSYDCSRTQARRRGSGARATRRRRVTRAECDYHFGRNRAAACEVALGQETEVA